MDEPIYGEGIEMQTEAVDAEGNKRVRQIGRVALPYIQCYVQNR